jgi:hypothetical protein
MNDALPVYLLANDIPPGLSMPVAAPGLRVWGMAAGLKDQGIDATILLSRATIGRQWKNSLPAPLPEGVEIISGRRTRKFLEQRAPAVVILTNSNQVDTVEGIEGISYILDLFAPKMLELVYQSDEFPADDVKRLRAQKLKAMNLADAFIVNGSKKIPYFLGWLTQTDRDFRKIELPNVFMCVPTSNLGPAERQDHVTLAMAGYLQAWSQPGPWVEEIAGVVDRDDVSLSVLLGKHWGGGDEEAESEVLQRLRSRDNVDWHSPMTYPDFSRFLEGVDVSVDVFGYNLEREYAVVTRSVVALCHGIPVIHPPFTEVSPLIAKYNAGWLVDPTEEGAVAKTLEELLNDRDRLMQKTNNARRLAREVLEPAKATSALAKIIRKLSSDS